MSQDRVSDTIRAAASAYAQLHFAAGVAERYDAIYEASGYDGVVWEWQRPFIRQELRSIAAGKGRLKYLDFACGTGRILAAVEDLATEAVGLDISPVMLALAAEKVRSPLRCGDVLAEPTIVDRDYDAITAFRFFLNTEPAMRLAVMRDLALRLRDGRSRLIFNIHGSRRSVLALTSLYRRLRGWPALGLMSPTEVQILVASSGLEITSVTRFGILPRRLYRTPLARAVGQIDHLASRLAVIMVAGQDLVYVCAPVGATRQS